MSPSRSISTSVIQCQTIIVWKQLFDGMVGLLLYLKIITESPVFCSKMTVFIVLLINIGDSGVGCAP